MAERVGFEPTMELPPNRISNWTQKRDQRDSEGVPRPDAGVSRNPEALERICGSTQDSTRQFRYPSARNVEDERAVIRQLLRVVEVVEVLGRPLDRAAVPDGMVIPAGVPAWATPRPPRGGLRRCVQPGAEVLHRAVVEEPVDGHPPGLVRVPVVRPARCPTLREGHRLVEIPRQQPPRAGMHPVGRRSKMALLAGGIVEVVLAPVRDVAGGDFNRPDPGGGEEVRQLIRRRSIDPIQSVPGEDCRHGRSGAGASGRRCRSVTEPEAQQLGLDCRRQAQLLEQKNICLGDQLITNEPVAFIDIPGHAPHL